jgi:hypothetical protein
LPHEQQTKAIEDQIAALKQKSAPPKRREEQAAAHARRPAGLADNPGIRDDFTKFSAIHLLYAVNRNRKERSSVRASDVRSPDRPNACPQYSLVAAAPASAHGAGDRESGVGESFHGGIVST